MSSRGNSHELVRKLLRAKQPVRIHTRLRNAAHALDDICAMDLIYNRDIPTYLDEVAREKALSKRREREALLLTDPRPFALVGASPVNERSRIEAELKAHGEVARTLLGSLDALTSDSKDGPRQACASARNALERLVRELTSEPQVKAGLAKLVGEAHAKVISKAYDALSAAVHGPAPTRKAAEFNVQVVLASCVMLAQTAKRE